MQQLFGWISDERMFLNQAGRIVQDCWADLPNHYPNIELDEFVVMPNHVHGILVILDDEPHSVRAGLRPARTKRYALSEIVRAFKSFSSRKINSMRGTMGRPVWQRNYYEHIIRDERSLGRIREYIDTNPQRWSLDRENPDKKGGDEFDSWLGSFSRHPAHESNSTLTI